MRKIVALVLKSLEKTNNLKRHISLKQARTKASAASSRGKSPRKETSDITEEELLELQREWNGYNQVI